MGCGIRCLFRHSSAPVSEIFTATRCHGFAGAPTRDVVGSRAPQPAMLLVRGRPNPRCFLRSSSDRSEPRCNFRREPCCGAVVPNGRCASEIRLHACALRHASVSAECVLVCQGTTLACYEAPRAAQTLTIPNSRPRAPSFLETFPMQHACNCAGRTSIGVHLAPEHC
jgi:hypothetical protein